MTKESWNDYQNQYRKNHYTQLSAHLDSELVKEFKNQLKKDNISFSSFLKTAISKYLEKELDK